MSVDAVVCGAGVGGLAAARALDTLGMRVLLVDKQQRPMPVAKGEVFQPGALRVLQSWGVAQRLAEDGALRLGRLVARDPAGEALMSLDYGTLPEPHRWLLAHDYPSILDALTAGLGSDVDIRRGVLVRGLLRDSDGRVTGVRLDGSGGEVNVRAPLVVAADGMSSRLRREAGIEIERAEYPHRLVALELAGTPGVEPDFSAYVTPRGLRLRYPLPGGRVRLYVQVRPDELRGLSADGLEAWVARLVAETPALAALEPAIRTSLPTRQVLPVGRFLAPALTVPGLALTGETGHAVHPMAAQGMNSAIADADCLAAVLAEHGGVADPAAVDRALTAYQQRRLPDLAHIGQVSHNAARMITDLSRPGLLVGRRALRYTGANRRLRYMVMHNMSGLGAHPLSLLDRVHQIGLLPDPRAGRLPAWA
ncbi:tungsten formylmethanofuran dehydrogenase [Amycolatopsis antarctica]|uniref:Tungsten formylmethanofuran dehydrogenase n=1 Tax=Amycolatopsis antarctica TaxID=1854586 RepID=A0A263D220_9PSEU|nr:NAD(P)/FAD-dependent oxidoreductase [Amycolatopsis antarctica]OZM72259.1 tungsten formylmethanofuran dehydrogenase [Amycolatopsis antarctica]